MFPLRDTIAARRFPWMTLFLIAINLFVFTYEMRLSPRAIELFVHRFGLIPARDFLPWLGFSAISFAGAKTFFTSLFIHGGLAHLIGNLWSLWLFGDNVEDRMGPIGFLLFYILCGVLASIGHCLLQSESIVPVIGASGAISGVMGAYLLLFPSARLKMLTFFVFYPITFEIPAFVFLLIWFLGQLLSGLISSSLALSGGIAFAAHIAGFLSGAFLMPVFVFVLGPRSRS